MVLVTNANESYVALGYIYIFFNTLLTSFLCFNQDLTKGNDTSIPEFDYQEKKRVGYKAIKSASSAVVS